MGMGLRIVAFRRHLPRLTDRDVADLKSRLDATSAGAFCTDLELDESWWRWPEKYRARGEDAPAAHVQAIEVGSGCRYFGPGYHRGDWPAFKAIIHWLREHVSPDVWYGAHEHDEHIQPATDELIAEHDAAWEASGEESWYGRADDGVSHAPSACDMA